MKKNEELKKLFEADLSGLFSLSLEELSREGELYCQVKSSYIQSDMTKLQDLVSFILNGEFSFELKLISEVRLGIRKRDFHFDNWQKQIDKIPNSNIWKGEILFSLAYAYDYNKDFFNARKIYVKAYKILLKYDCKNKALLSLHNAIAVTGNQYPDKRQFSDYHELLKQAKKYNCKNVIGLAHLNLSIEYQKTGAIQSALNEINKGLSLLEIEFDSDQYYLSLAQKCDILLDFKRYNEAEKLMDLLKSSPHDFSKGALRNLEERIAFEKLNQKIDGTNSNIIFSPTFSQRREILKNHKKSKPFGKLEEKLIQLLLESPKDKITLIHELYGDSEDYFALEGRFKSLLVRIRKKIPFSIVFYNDHYQIDGELQELDKIIG